MFGWNGISWPSTSRRSGKRVASPSTASCASGFPRLAPAQYGIVGGDSADLVIAPWWALALVPIGTLVMVAGATSLPALLATRISAVDALRYE
jgi:hypothetical protein